jgi:hypothetical protein
MGASTLSSDYNVGEILNSWVGVETGAVKSGGGITHHRLAEASHLCRGTSGPGVGACRNSWRKELGPWSVARGVGAAVLAISDSTIED